MLQLKYLKIINVKPVQFIGSEVCSWNKILHLIYPSSMVLWILLFIGFI